MHAYNHNTTPLPPIKPVTFSNKLKPHCIGPYKDINHRSHVTYELMARNGSVLHTHRYQILRHYLENLSSSHIFVYIVQHHLLSTNYSYQNYKTSHSNNF